MGLLPQGFGLVFVFWIQFRVEIRSVLQRVVGYTVGPYMGPRLSVKPWTQNPNTLFGILCDTWLVSSFVKDACDSNEGVTHGNERGEKTTLIVWLTSMLVICEISLLAV